VVKNTTTKRISVKKALRIKVRPGPIQVAGCYVRARGVGCLVVEIDCLSKFPRIHSYGEDEHGNPAVFLGANTCTIKTDNRFKRGTTTVVSFPEFKAGCDSADWHIHSVSEGGRYIVGLTLLQLGSPLEDAIVEMVDPSPETLKR
jgi:hypothetical protein